MLSVARIRSAVGPDELDDLAVRRAAAGDREASRRLVERYQHQVFALISRMLPARTRATIEDVAQETFLSVFSALPRFHSDGTARLSTWILTIAARKAIDEMRRKRPDLPGEIERAGTSRTDEPARRKEIMTAIERALAELSPELRAAFLLREYHDLEYAEIAASLGIDLGTVKSRLARARAALRDALAEVHHV